MSESWPTVPLGKIAALSIQRTVVDRDASYRMAGVLNAGRGLFSRGQVPGHETRYPALHRLIAGQLVMRKLTAWEGPITVVPEEFDGAHVSTEFPTFSLDRRFIVPEFMGLVCRQPWFWEEMRLRSSGSVQRRKRLSPSGLLTVEFALPPLEAQRRIVDVIGAADGAVKGYHALAFSAGRLGAALRHDHFGLPSSSSAEAGSVFEIAIGRQRSPDRASGDHPVSYLRAANVKDGHLDLGDVKQMNFLPSEQAQYRLLRGDVLVTEGCGSIGQLGASAVWRSDLPDPICFQNTLLRVRARPGLSIPAYAYQWARYCFESGAFAAVASGTNIFHIGVQRARTLIVGKRSPAEQEAFCALADPVDAVAERARASVETASATRSALLGDLLFRRQEIPQSYDRFLGIAA